MTAELILPNIRRLFIPDPGMIMLDCDLKGADAQVVAWEADDEELKEAFRNGLDVHTFNATAMFGEEFTKHPVNSPPYSHIRKMNKSAVHAFNYLGSARTVAITLGWTIERASAFKSRWFALHPGIPRWHGRLQDSLERARKVTNKFGFHRIYFDRIETILPEAVAWVPQSTIANTCFVGALQVEDQLPWVQILLQNHDSLVMQIPIHRVRDLLLLRRALTNTIPYPDPLVVPWEISLSTKSWGDVQKMSWEAASELKF